MVCVRFYEWNERVCKGYRSIPYFSENGKIWVVKKNKGYLNNEEVYEIQSESEREMRGKTPREISRARSVFYQTGQDKFIRVKLERRGEDDGFVTEEVLTEQELSQLYPLPIPKQTKAFMMVWEVHADLYDLDAPIGLFATFHESEHDWADGCEENAVQKGGFYVQMSTEKVHELIYNNDGRYVCLIKYPNRLESFMPTKDPLPKQLQDLGVDFKKICSNFEVVWS